VPARSQTHPPVRSTIAVSHTHRHQALRCSSPFRGGSYSVCRSRRDLVLWRIGATATALASLTSSSVAGAALGAFSVLSGTAPAQSLASPPHGAMASRDGSAGGWRRSFKSAKWP
jgi:hypothetical protein